ncbi:hypothetical protein [Porphyromonas sp.]|uniref:hypothetical protein n=1 Tax=Porphyromonas sp. TaxID=1924944 RepID=UPI003995F4FE
MRSSKRRLTALILTACLLLSCGSRRHRTHTESHEQSQQRSEQAVREATQHSRDSTIEEWELLLLDTIIPQSEIKLVSGDSLLGVTWSERPAVRYRYARRRVVQEQDSVAQQRNKLEDVAQQQNHRLQEAVTERQPTGRIAHRLRFGLLIGGLLIIIGAATLICRGVGLRTKSVFRKDIVLR